MFTCSIWNWLHLLQVSLENFLFSHTGEQYPWRRGPCLYLEAVQHLWRKGLKSLTQFSFLCAVEDKAVMFVVVYMVWNSTNSTFLRTDAQVYLWCSMACRSLDHDIKDIITWCVLREIKCHRLTRILTGTTAKQRQFLSVCKWATPSYIGMK